jgi:hypothetical protein
VVLGCLLGILQPALACAAACAPTTDCCPAGPQAGRGEQLHERAFSVQSTGCCELRPTVATSVAVIGATRDQGHPTGSSAPIAPPPTPFQIGRPPHQLGAPAAQIPDYPDQSLTYLRTARLRL